MLRAAGTKSRASSLKYSVDPQHRTGIYPRSQRDADVIYCGFGAVNYGRAGKDQTKRALVGTVLSAMVRRYAFPILFLLAICHSLCLAAGKPANVLVVQNSNSPMSMRIAAYYMSARGVPSGNLASISTVDSGTSSANETVTYANYISQIGSPIWNYMTAHGLVNTIQYIVLTKGVPHKISTEVTGGSSGGQSVDSMLASVDLVNPMQVSFEDTNHNLLGTLYINRYWRSTQSFSHTTYGGYLVTRLDGYTEADAKALVDHAMAACTTPPHLLLDGQSDPGPTVVASEPKSILLPDGSGIDPNYQLKYADYDGDIIRASQVISGRPFLDVQLDKTSTFLGSANPLTCYVSWGSNAGAANYSADTYHSLTFAPRALAETAVSTSGRTLFPNTGGQSMIADLVAQGVSGAKGYVTEPYLDAIASPTVFMDLYTSGHNLAESFYAASRFVGWKDIVLGDPLCALDLTDGAVPSAKAATDQSLVSVINGVVTAGTDDFASCIYVQDAQLPAGIRVELPTTHPSVPRGTTVTVRGFLSTTADGERVITNAQVAF